MVHLSFLAVLCSVHLVGCLRNYFDLSPLVSVCQSFALKIIMYFFTTTALLASSLGAATASYGYEQELYARDLDSSGLHAHAPRDAEPAYGSYRRDVDDMDDYHHMLDARNAELEDEDLYRREAQFDNEDLYRRDADFDDEDLYRREAEFGDEDLYRRDADIDNEDLYRREAALNEDDLFRRDAELDDDDLYRREAAYDDLYRREAAYDDLYRREADYDEPHFGDASDLFARAAGTEQCKMGCTSRYVSLRHDPALPHNLSSTD